MLTQSSFSILNKISALSVGALFVCSATATYAIASSTSAQEQIQEQAIDLETAIGYYNLNEWLPALLGFQVLADGGDPVAQAYIGVMYREGLGIKKDFEEAEKWLTMGAKNGNAWAQHQLGWMYARAEITDDRDFESAVKLWQEAAEGGNTGAQVDLAVMYWRGEGAPKNMVMAYVWLKLAERDKDVAGMADVNMTGLKQQMSPEQIKAAEELAETYKAQIAYKP